MKTEFLVRLGIACVVIILLLSFPTSAQEVNKHQKPQGVLNR